MTKGWKLFIAVVSVLTPIIVALITVVVPLLHEDVRKAHPIPEPVIEEPAQPPMGWEIYYDEEGHPEMQRCIGPCGGVEFDPETGRPIRKGPLEPEGFEVPPVAAPAEGGGMDEFKDIHEG